MPKFALDRIKNRHGFTGGKYRELMTDIISHNNENVQRATGRLSKNSFNKSFKKNGTVMTMPDVESVLPKRSVFLRKGAEQGELINEKLRDNLTKNIRDTIKNFKTKTGRPSFIQTTGINVGRINPKLLEEFRGTITKTFEKYTKKGVLTDIPSNIDVIATTEMRSAISDMKESYSDRLLKENPDKIKIKKTWLQHKSESKNPRRGHNRVHGQTMQKDGLFKVYTYVKIGKRFFINGFDMMKRPHDPDGSAENVINCHCEIIYKVYLIK